jgi:hypothetical protein
VSCASTDANGRGRPIRSLIMPWCPKCVSAVKNVAIGESDRVFHLGDFAYGCSLAHARAIFGRLNGHKTLLLSGHAKWQ